MKEAADLGGLGTPRHEHEGLFGSVSGLNCVGLDAQSPRDQFYILAQGSIGACIMDAITLVAFIGSMYVAGRIAERRGRSVKIWAWIAAIIGPLALPLVFLFPNSHDKNGDHA